jgi:hypothetical protein
MNDHERPTIPLATAINELRVELLKAIDQGRDEKLRFKLKPIELNLQVVTTWEAEGGGKVKFWVVELGGKGKYENAITHSLKLTLVPVGDGESEILVTQTEGDKPV